MAAHRSPGGDRNLSKGKPMEELRKRDLLVSKVWIQAVILVVVFGFFVLGLLAYRTYSGEAPIPARVVDQNGNTLFTHDDILDGQQVFLRNGLMEYGSIFGHGAYLVPITPPTTCAVRQPACTKFTGAKNPIVRTLRPWRNSRPIVTTRGATLSG